MLAKTKTKAAKPDSKVWWIGGGLLLVLLAAVLVMKTVFKPPVESYHIPLVKTERIIAGTDAQSYTYPGEVRARYESQLAFQVGGRIIKRNVDVGSSVRAGDILLQIDPRDIQQSLTGAGAAVASARSQLKLAEANLERYRRLYESGAISKSDYDRVQTAYETAQAALQQAVAGYSGVGNQMEYSRLIANSDGVVSELNAEVGQVVGAGQRVVTVVQDGEMEIEINVPENRLEELKQAQSITVSFWALNDVVSRGKVREIAPMADKAARTYKVRISLVDKVPQIKLGMTAKVTITPQNGKIACYVPISAIYQSGDTPSVWVVQDNKVKLVPVRIGRFADNKVEILEGLEKDALVVTAGVHKLQDGDIVRIAGEGK